MAILLIRAIVLIVAVLCCTGAFANNITEAVSYLSQSSAQEETSQPPALDRFTYACEVNITHGHTCQIDCDKYAWDRSQFCHCDSLCTRYGDCCHDYGEYCGSKAMVRPVPGFHTGRSVGVEWSPLDKFTKCTQTTSFEVNKFRPRIGHYLVAVCPHDWSGDSGIRNLCQEAAGFDELGAVPVEGTHGRHYKNVYCAMCHGLPFGNATFWSVFYERDFSFRARNVNFTSFLQNAIQNPFRFYPPGFHSLFVSEELMTSSLRSCIVLDPITCAFSAPDVQALCEQQVAPMVFGGTTYKNVVCYQCNKSVSVSVMDFEMHCKDLLKLGYGGTRETSMAVLFIFTDHADLSDRLRGEMSAGSSSCAENQIYDPFKSFCRDMTCPDNFFLTNFGRCARSHESIATRSMAIVEVALTVTGHFRDGSGAQKSDDIWEAVAGKAVDDYVSSVSICNDGEEDVGETGPSDQGRNECENLNLTWTCNMGAHTLIPAEASCGTGNVFTCNVNVSFITNTPSLGILLDENKLVIGKCFQGNVWNHTTRMDYFTVSASCELQSNQSDDSYDGLKTVSKSQVAYVYDDDSGDFFVSQNDSCMKVDCPLLTISNDDYMMTGALNDSIRLTQYDRVLQRGEFRLKSNGEAEVCNFLQAVAAIPDDMWINAQVILTVSGSSLSLIGLVVTIVTYVSFPSLRRNAAGKSLMCLVASLFFAQLTMLIGLDRTDVFAVCVAFAISSHYFWLSAFFWMNILAIDIYRTFGIGTKINDPSARSVRYYALYGLGAPAVIVGTCVFFSFCDCVDLDVHYASEHACWIGNGMTNLVSFGVPIVVILCSNAVLFSLTVAGVMKTRRASQRMNITQGQGDSATKTRNDIILYLKLTAIMGFTWVFGFVASFSGVQFFWYPFIVLNSLQGALVCLAFVCNQRVLTMWKARLRGGDGQQSSSNFSSSRRA